MSRKARKESGTKANNFETVSNVVLVSWGGCGTKMAWAHWGRHRLCQGFGATFNHHQRFPSVPDYRTAKILYFIGHPLESLLSLSFKESKIWERSASKIMMQGDQNALARMKSLMDYLNYGQNCFDWYGHYLGWVRFAQDQHIPFYLQRYDDLKRGWAELDNYVGIKPIRQIGWKERSYKWDQWVARNPEYRGLEDIHARDIQFYMESETGIISLH